LLTPQFQPLYRRMAFLDSIPNIPIEPWQTRPERIQAFVTRFRHDFYELRGFIEALKMGGYYLRLLDKIFEEISLPSYPFYDHTNPLHALIKGQSRLWATRSRLEGYEEQIFVERQQAIRDMSVSMDKITSARDKMQGVIMEMLRYQEWPTPAMIRQRD
jgi:hypothetical protein